MTVGNSIIRLAALLLVLLVPAVVEAEPIGSVRPALETGTLPEGGWPKARPSPIFTPVQYCRYGVAKLCATTYGACYLGGPLCVGDPCYCPSAYGPVWGVAR